MNAVVLAGGYATRLWPITRNRPKMFLPVGEEAVVDHVFEQLEADGRVQDVYVSTNERFAEDFRRHLAASDFEKPVLSVEETTGEDEKLGVVGALAQLVDREGLDGDTLVIAGDNVISFDVGDMLDAFEAKGDPVLAAYDVGSLERAKAYGVLGLDGDRVTEFQEKPEDPQSSLVSIACYAFTRETLPLLDEYLEAGENPDEPGWFVQWLQARSPVYAYGFEEAWFDIGSPESYLDAVAWELDGRAHVDDAATVRDSDLAGDVQVAADATVEDAHLERCVVLEGATVRDCELRDSIVGERATLAGLHSEGALVGDDTHVENER